MKSQEERGEKMKNIEIRMALMKAGIKNYQLAELLGITETSLSRKLRNELPEDEKERILAIIMKGA